MRESCFFSTMISKILNNPFRILGLFSSATKDEINSSFEENRSAYIAGSVVYSQNEFNLILPRLTKTLDGIVSAKTELSSPDSRVKAALFWFCCATLADEQFLKLLSNGMIESAIEKYSTTENTYSKHINMSVISMIKGDYGTSIRNMLNLTRSQQPSEEFVLITGGPFASIKAREMWEYYIMIVYEQFSGDTKAFFKIAWANGCYDEVDFLKESKKKKKPLVKPNSDVYIVSKVPENEVLEEVKQEFSDATGYLNELERVYSTTTVDTEDIQSIVAETAHKAFAHSINGFNKAFNHVLDSESSCIYAIQQTDRVLSKLEKLPLPITLSNLITKQYNIVKDAAKDPKDYILKVIANDKTICWFCGKSATTTVYIPYSKSTSRKKSAYRVTTTTTKAISFHVCESCKKKVESYRHREKVSRWIVSILALALELLVAFLLVATIKYHDYLWHWDCVWWVLGLNLILGFIPTGIFSLPLKPFFDRLFGLRKEDVGFDREIDDHPQVKSLQNMGYS